MDKYIADKINKCIKGITFSDYVVFSHYPLYYRILHQKNRHYTVELNREYYNNAIKEK